jgi:hypothetical protein
MNKGSKIKNYILYIYHSGVGIIFHRNINRGHANVYRTLGLHEATTSGLCLSKQQRERIAWVEKDNGEYTGKHLLYEWTKLYA